MNCTYNFLCVSVLNEEFKTLLMLFETDLQHVI